MERRYGKELKMYRIPINNWFHRMHLPTTHTTAEKLKHMLADDRFWAVVGLCVLVLMLIIMAIAAMNSDAPTTNFRFSPYGPFVP